MFDQKMRQHLERCFRQRKLSSFPHSIGYKPKQMHFPFHEIEVFCTCQTPKTWDNMVCCDSCGEWYHLRCINLRSMLNSVEQWFCSACNLLQFLFLSLFDSMFMIVSDINDAVKHSQSHSTTKKKRYIGRGPHIYHRYISM